MAKRTQSRARRNSLATALLAVLVWLFLTPPASAQLGLGSLIVTITSPTSGSVVRNTIPVNAGVSIVGALTVSRVEFYVDGRFLGNDTGSPYSVSWDTRTVSNGSHTLSAVAVDLLGIRWNSSPVTVTVSNPPTITAFSPISGPVGTSVTISGTNFTGATAVRFNGASASFTVNSSTSITTTVPSGATTGPITVTTPGDTATSAASFTVTANPPTITGFSPTSGPVGTSVTISGTNFTGATAVRFNGTNASFTVNSSTSITATVTAGATTGPITVTTPGGTATSSTSFTVTAGGSTVTRFEETAVTFVGTWSRFADGQTGVTSSNGTVMASEAAGATATLTFTGTGIRWVGFPCEVCGIANVYLDAGTTPATTLVATVDTFEATRPSTTTALWTSAPLAAGTYTVGIEVTGTPNPSSGGGFIVVDAFEVVGSSDSSSPRNTTAPAVTITSPASGQTVSGTVPVIADASDDVAVASVEFFVDRTSLGTDTTAPYGVAWDTTAAAPGSQHTLTALARDAAGNSATSAPVTVTVGTAASGSSEVGDVFVSLETGPVQWRRPDGTLRATLVGTTGGTGEGMAFDGRGNLYVTRWCIDSPCTTGNTVEIFNTFGQLQGTFGRGYNCDPHAIVFDAAGAAYVGQGGCRGSILKFAPGALDPIAEFPIAPDNQGAFWIDLAPNGCTMYYTSFGPNVKRFDVCTGVQLADFNASPLPGGAAQDLRVLPDGSVLVSSGDVIVRLNATGTLVQTYSVPGETSPWAGLDLIGDGTFWAGNYESSNVYRFDLATGAVLATFNTGTPPHTVVGVRMRK